MSITTNRIIDYKVEYSDFFGHHDFVHTDLFVFVSRYMDELMRLKAAAREEGSEYLTWNDIQASVDQVNSTIQEEHESESYMSYSPQADLAGHH